MSTSSPGAPSVRDEEIARELVRDLKFFARSLTIRPKGGALARLILNRAQQFIHGRLDAQLRETGRVRALILKGRQQGCSTYVAARFYHRAINEKGVRVFILTHEEAATQNLFEIVERFHAHCHPRLKPSTGAANAKELYFDALESGYKVGTAGTKGVGRSATIQLFHGSEVAFWPHGETHAAGALQAVPDAAGTEVILESTAYGMGNFFHETWPAPRPARATTSRSSYPGTGRTSIAGIRRPTSCRARRSRPTPTCTASTMHSSPGGAPRSPSSRTRPYSARNIPRARRKPSR
jgi:hypothetical protein